MSPLDVVYMLALYRHDVPIKQIVRLVPCSKGQLEYWSQKYNLPARYPKKYWVNRAGQSELFREDSSNTTPKKK